MLQYYSTIRNGIHRLYNVFHSFEQRKQSSVVIRAILYLTQNRTKLNDIWPMSVINSVISTMCPFTEPGVLHSLLFSEDLGVCLLGILEDEMDQTGSRVIDVW